jgi:hypothetical protein
MRRGVSSQAADGNVMDTLSDVKANLSIKGFNTPPSQRSSII